MISQVWMLGGGAPGQEGNPIMQFAPLILIMIVFYFFMIRPQMKKAKEQKQFRESLKEGDNVITIGGIHGKIVKLDDTTVILEMIDKSRIKIERSALVPDSASTMGNQGK
jgi:preprotein translocase subunit YajC